MPPAELNRRINAIMELLAGVVMEVRTIQNEYWERKDWKHFGPYNQVQQKLGEVLLTLEKLRKGPEPLDPPKERNAP